MVALLFIGRWVEWTASPRLVFERGEIWRAWTTVFAHADWSHLLSNLILFVPFSYALLSYFSPWFFPLAGFVAGGLVNLAVLAGMPAGAHLVGLSGVVYWMGAAWITLGFLLDRRAKAIVRAVKALGVSLLLFAPQLYKPEVSYLAHALGYVFGVASALAYYRLRRAEFRAAERHDFTYDFDAHWNPETNGYSEELPTDFPTPKPTSSRRPCTSPTCAP